MHLRTGWIALLLFVSLGAALEALHAWKSEAYLGAANEPRRLMWTLAHAHGVGLALLQIGFAATLKLADRALTPRLQLASRLLNAATLLLPGGFFLGGLVIYDGDPGPAVWLVPLGALLLWTAIALVVVELRGPPRP